MRPFKKVLLLSPPGTGKTTACIELFKNEILKTSAGIESRAFFILPSREHAERIQNLVLKKGLPGLFNVHILTINDFASRMLGFHASSRPTASLRKAVLKKVLEETGGLDAFEAVKGLAGFQDLLVDAIREFKTGLLSVREFETLSQPLLKDPIFRGKFKDFCLVFKKVEAELEKLGLREPEDDIREILANGLSGEAADLVIFDGFYDFARAQKALIGLVSRWARKTVVTLTMPEDKKERPPLFTYPRRTREFLEKEGFVVSGEFAENHRAKNPVLRHLERNIFCDKPALFKNPENALMVLESPDPRTEIEMIAREIKKLYREETLHYSDICVILRQVADTEGLIASVFADFDIPVHIHERKKLMEVGPAATLHRFLKLLEEGWRREDLFYVLKSNCFRDGSDFERALALERAAQNENVREGRLSWEGLLGSERLTDDQKQPLSHLMEFEKKLLAASTVKAFNREILDWLGGEIPDALKALLKKCELYYGASRKRSFSAAVCAAHLKIAIEGALFSVKVYGKNRVQVYDAVMALPKEYKVVFLSGLLEKRFPQSISEDPLFKDAQRRVLNRKGVVLEERLWRVDGERYFFYMAATRAREKLYLTFSTHDAEEKPALKSFFVEEALKCFDHVPQRVKSVGQFLPEPGEWESGRDMTRGMAEILFKASLSGVHARIEDPEALQLFGAMRGPFSATKLESYATCAFKYFAERVLRLTPPPEGLEHRQMGDLLHQTIEEFYKELPESDRANPAFWSDEDKVSSRLHQKLESLTRPEAFGYEPLYRRKIFSRRMKEMLSLFARREKELVIQRGFVPSQFEYEFQIDLDGIPIEGKIDRMDVSPDRRAGIVIDYKKSAGAGGLRKKWEKGMGLQLPLYVLAARRSLGLEVLGAELRFLESADEESFFEESLRDALGPGSRKKLYDKGEFEAILKNAEASIKDVVRRLQAGDIAIKSKSCDFCPYDAVCRFETWKAIYE
ncbi:MAG: exodeoxyribonuclease V subunit gamma [Candidatus Omnitrophica bacterium]|nr:exodeoxyribonuclease V subunit gamma [Candidatus Omnitrophota bacterium]